MAIDLNGIIGQVTAAMMTAAKSTSTNLIGEGNQILMALLLVLITWELIKTFLGEDWAMTQVSIMQILLKWAIVTLMLNEWSYVGTLFSDGFESLARQAAGAGSTPGTYVDLGWDTIKSLFGLGELNGANQPCSVLGCQPTPPAATSSSGGNWWDAIKSFAFSFSSIGLLIVGLIIKLVVAFIVALTVVAILTVSMLGVFMLAVGLTVGPIMVPFLLLQQLSYLFDSWLKFMITGGMVKIIAAVTLAFMGSVFTQMNAISKIANNSTELGVDLLALLSLAVISWMGLNLAWKVPEFANSLLMGQSVGGAKTLARRPI